MTGLETLAFATAVIGGVSLFLFIYVKGFGSSQKTGFGAPVPAIPGVPVIGNLLQLKEKKPHKTFTQWAETYGPIFSIKAGASTVVVVNSTDTAKEAMVTRFSSISTRKLSSALKVLTYDKCMVATSDYNDFHKMVKGLILRNVLGATAQKRHRSHRDTMIDNIIKFLHDHLETNPLGHVVLKESFKSEIFGLALKQALGEDLESIYVPELQADLSREEIFTILVADPMAGAIEVDWRDFFPFLRWIPNKTMERKIQRIDHRRGLVMKALIEKQKKRIASGEERNCYVDFLLAEATNLTEKQIAMLIWETIIEISDTTLVTSEWAMYELAKDKKRQEILYQEIEKVCGSNKLTEEDLPQLQYLNCVFHETLRKYSPAPIVPLRYAHENTTLGGYHVPAGTEIALNLYGCNMNKKQWKNPEKWKPERFLDVKYDQADLHKTMAFGGGKRVCAGALQASLIAGAAIGRLIQEFEWRLVEGEEEDVDTMALTSQKLNPMKAIIKRRSRDEKWETSNE